MTKIKKREFAPIKGTMPNPNTIFCSDCAFRDKTTIKVGDEVIPVGVTKSYCDVFVKPNSKPTEILFDEAPCDYYVMEGDTDG